MTPKFRPPAFRRLLIAAAGLVVASAPSYAVSSTLTWVGTNGATWDDTQALNWTNTSGFHQAYTDGDAVIFDGSNLGKNVTVYVLGVSPMSVTITGETIFSAASSPIKGISSLTISGVNTLIIDSYGGIDDSYSGAVKLKSNNSFTGNSSISDSFVSLENSYGFGSASNRITVNDGSTLILSNDSSSMPINPLNPLTIAGYGGRQLNSGAYVGALSNFVGSNTYSGLITLTAESCITNSNSEFLKTTGPLTLAGGINNSGTSAKGVAVVFDGNDQIVVNTVGISGTGSVIKQGSGTLNLNVANSYSGKTAINAGIVNATTDALAGTSRIVVSGGTLNAVNLGASTSLYIGAGGAVTVSGADLTLGDIYNYSASAGSLQFTATAGTISLHSLYVDSTTTNVTTTFASNLNLQTGSINNTNAVTYAGTLTGGTVVPVIPYIANITSGNVTVTGAVNIGTIDYGAKPFTGSVTCNGSATVDTIYSGTVNFNDNAAVTTLNGGDITIGYKKVLTVQGGDSSDTISGFGSLLKTSANILTLSGANDYTGGTTISAGKIIGDTTSVQGDIVNNAELEFAQSGDGKFVSRITGSGLVTKSGTGEFEVTETGSITAKTFNFTEGKLLNNGTISGAINLSAGTILAGSGTLAGNITVTDATVSPGNSPGVLNVSGSFTQNGGTFVAELGGTTPGSTNTSHDQLNVYSGSVILTGSPVLEVHQWLAFEPARGDVFQIIKSSGGIRGEFADFINTDYNKILIFAQHTGAVYGTGLLSTGSFVDWAGSNTQLQTIYQTVWDNAVAESTSSSFANPAAFIDGSSSDGKLAIAIITGAAIDTDLFATDAAESYLGLTDYTNITTRSVMDQAMLRNSFYRQGRWSIGGDINYVTNTYKGGSSADFNRKLSSATAFVAVNYELHDTMGVGFFLGFNDGKSSTANLDMKMKGTVFGLNAYKNFLSKNPVTLKAAVTTTRLSFDSVRMLYGDATSNANSQKVAGMGAELTAAIQLYKQDGLTVSPMVGLVYGSSKADNFSETGSSFALSVHDLKSNSTNGILGLSVDCVANARLAFNFLAAYEKILSGGNDELSASSVGGLSPDLAIIDQKSKTIFTLGAGISFRNSVRSMINFGAQFRSSSDYSKDLRLNASYIKKF